MGDKLNHIYIIIVVPMETDIETAIGYAIQIVGTPYEWWNPDKNMLDGNEPFWAENTPAPSVETVIGKSCNCVGLINLMRRSINKPIHGVYERYIYAGGTYVWFEYLYRQNLLDEFKFTKIYPRGTLLLRNYTDVVDQGHVAVILTEETNPEIIHCYSNVPHQNEYNPYCSGVRIERLELSHKWIPTGYYTHACLSTDWLTK
jgi:hypothetical protein